jgi:hypothetical protein
MVEERLKSLYSQKDKDYPGKGKVTIGRSERAQGADIRKTLYKISDQQEARKHWSNSRHVSLKRGKYLNTLKI